MGKNEAQIKTLLVKMLIKKAQQANRKTSPNYVIDSSFVSMNKGTEYAVLASNNIPSNLIKQFGDRELAKIACIKYFNKFEYYWTSGFNPVPNEDIELVKEVFKKAFFLSFGEHIGECNTL